MQRKDDCHGSCEGIAYYNMMANGVFFVSNTARLGVGYIRDIHSYMYPYSTILINNVKQTRTDPYGSRACCSQARVVLCKDVGLCLMNSLLHFA